MTYDRQPLKEYPKKANDLDPRLPAKPSKVRQTGLRQTRKTQTVETMIFPKGRHEQLLRQNKPFFAIRQNNLMVRLQEQRQFQREWLLP